MNKSDLVQIREYKSSDENFIFSTFLKGVYHGQSVYNLIPSNIFMENYHKVLEFIMKNPSSIVKIACLKDDEDTILGYSLSSDKALHWIFVKKAWRNIGIAKYLMPSNINTVTHLSKVGISILIKKGFTYNPFII